MNTGAALRPAIALNARGKTKRVILKELQKGDGTLFLVLLFVRVLETARTAFSFNELVV